MDPIIQPSSEIGRIPSKISVKKESQIIKEPKTITQKLTELRDMHMLLFKKLGRLHEVQEELQKLGEHAKQPDERRREVDERIEKLKEEFLQLQTTGPFLEEDLDILTNSWDPRKLSPDEFGEVFAFESQLRDQINSETDPDRRKGLSNFHSEMILKALKEIKEELRTRKKFVVAKGAALKGQAAQAGFEAIHRGSRFESIVNRRVESRQEVFILHGVGGWRTVLKASKPTADVEEEIAGQLFQIFSPGSAVESFRMKQTSMRPFGMQRTAEQLEDIFSLDSFSSESIDFLKERMSLENQTILALALKTSSPSPSEKNYQEMQKRNWQVMVADGEWETLSFANLEKQYSAGKLNETTLIRVEGEEEGVSLEAHFDENTALCQALAFQPTKRSTLGNIYIGLDLYSFEVYNFYEDCKELAWKYRDKEGIEHEGNFQLLLQADLNGKMEEITEIRLRDGEVYTGSQQVVLDFMRKTPLKVFGEELFRKESGQLKPLERVRAKPYIDDMQLASDLIQKGELDKLLRFLSVEGEYQAMLTGVVQLMDLHPNNLGIRIRKNENEKLFENIKFTLRSGRTITFENLKKKILNGTLNEDNTVQFEKDGQTVSDQIKKFPELMSALDITTDLVLFDLDVSVGESNFLRRLEHEGVIGHYIPIHSVLLETTWKDTPLRPETIARLRQQPEKVQLEQWVDKADAPIYKRMSEVGKKKVEELVAPFLQEYELRKYPNEHYSVKDLEGFFSEEICNVSNPDCLEIWKTLEIELSSSSKTSHDLTSNKEEVVKRRERIAPQLFPRLTLAQKKALFERLENVKQYLDTYEKIKNMPVTDPKFLDEVFSFVEKNSTPLNTIERVKNHEYINKLKVKKNRDNSLLERLKKDILTMCQPTYFNVMKSMYLLIPDEYQLRRELGATDMDSGASIGNWKLPLELLLSQAEGETEGRISDLVDFIKAVMEETDPAAWTYTPQESR